MQELKHIAIIMDGNGRWAQNQGKNRTFGHKQGVKTVREITKYCASKNIPFLTLYAFSTENWLRPQQEVDFLMHLLERYLKSELKVYQEHNIRFVAIGDISVLKPKLQKLIHTTQMITAKNTGLTQLLALNYGAKNELARCVLELYKSGQLDSLSKLEQQDSLKAVECGIESHLDTKCAGEVDLLIRTGGEKRLSNFLLWQCAYAELFWTDTLFPDFSTKELEEIIACFFKRIRRFGGVLNLQEGSNG